MMCSTEARNFSSCVGGMTIETSAYCSPAANSDLSAAIIRRLSSLRKTLMHEMPEGPPAERTSTDLFTRRIMSYPLKHGNTSIRLILLQYHSTCESNGNLGKPRGKDDPCGRLFYTIYATSQNFLISSLPKPNMHLS